MNKKLAEKLANPKYIQKLIRRQKRFNLRVSVFIIAAVAYVIKAEERAAMQELKIDQLSRDLEELKRGKGV